jgi:hypothetical protein
MTRIEQRLYQQLEQQLTKEREAWCVILADRIVEERQQMLAMVEAEHGKVVEGVKAEQKMINPVKAAYERNKQLVDDVIERSDQFVKRVIERMEEERQRCSAELDRIDDADTGS